MPSPRGSVTGVNPGPKEKNPPPKAPEEKTGPDALHTYMAPPPPARDASGATEYVDVRKLVPHRVVGVLVAVEGDLEGEIYRVVDGENRIGRSPDCEIELSSKKISREHAKLIHRDGVFAIAPLSDKNPTFVNDEPTQGSELGDGDSIRLGRTTLRFRSIA